MSNTYRFYNNNTRVATAVQSKGYNSILQVFPERKIFRSKDAWEGYWKMQSKPQLTQEISDNQQKNYPHVVRLYRDGQRIATAITRGPIHRDFATIVQVFPRPNGRRRAFCGTQDWENHWEDILTNTHVEEKTFVAKKPKKEKVVASNTTTTTTTNKTPTCPVCFDPVPAPRGCIAGSDGSHRMCLVRGFREGLFNSVDEWSKMSHR